MKTLLLPRANVLQIILPLALLCCLFTHISYAGHHEGKQTPSSPTDICPILVGTSIPQLTLHDTQGKPFNLAKALDKQASLLIFYRGSWCPYCNTHLADLRKIEQQLIDSDVQIIAISPDKPEFLRETGTKNKLNYTLLSDSKMVASQALGLAYKVDETTQKKLKSYKIDLEKNSGESHKLLPVPAAILVDKGGKVSFIYVSPDYKARVNKDVLLAASKQLKH